MFTFLFERGQEAVLTHFDDFLDSIVFLFILSVVVEDYMEKKLFESLKKIVYTMLS